MRILLVDPSTHPAVAPRKRGIGRFPQVSLQYIAALTPPEHEVAIVEEETQPIDLDAECDLVGITCMTATAPRAYALADELRRRGKRVVLGGVHPTVLPDEASAHADAVVIGEAEPVWATLLEDAKRDELKPVYRSNNDWSLDDYPTPRRDLSHSRAVLGIVPVVTSRGCPYACEFCCVRNVFGRAIRHVSVQRVIDDIDRSGAKRVMFLDDNIVGDPRYAEELFTALEGRGIQWVGQASISFVRNEKLLLKAARSGCTGLFIGLESVSEAKMARMQKSMKSVAATEAAIRRITQAGILFHASIVFGFDDDETSIFDETLEFMYRTRMSSATFNILTPYPGTVLFDQFRTEGRLLTKDWSSYDHCTPTFIPKNMSVDQLAEGCQHVRRSFYSLASIAARFPANWRTPVVYTLANVGQRAGVRKEEREAHHGSIFELALSAVRSIRT